MMDPETRRFIQEEIRRQVNIILHAETDGTDGEKFTEGVSNLFPGQPTITDRPVMHPFGLMSRAVKGTLSVIARVGDHIGNRMVIGHRDADRPDDLEDGETALYNAKGQRIYLKSGKILIGSADADSPVVLGDVMMKALGEVLDELKSLSDTLQNKPAGLSTVPGNPIAPNPAFVADLVALDVKISTAKSTYISTSSSNIVSQEVFTERGGSL